MEPTAIIAIMTLAAAAVASLQGEKPMPTGPHEFGLNDLDLWNRVYSGQRLLSGIGFDRAVLEDPRRIFGLIEQEVFQALQEVYPQSTESVRMQLAMQLEKSDFLRQGHEGQLPLSALITFEDAYAPTAMEMSLGHFPDDVRAAFRHDIGRVSAAYDRGAKVARDAAEVATMNDRSRDAVMWGELEGTVNRMGHRIVSEFSGPKRLPGPAEGVLMPAVRLGDDEVNG